VVTMMKKFVLLLMFAIVFDASATGKSDQLPPPAVMKTLGLIGGTSWYSTVDYYRYINKAVNDAYANNTNPPLIVFNLNQQRINELQNRAQWDEIASTFVDTIKRLQACGAQSIVFCSNTSYKVYDKVAARTSIPILHIGDATGQAIQKQGLKKVGLIGTQYTMDFLDRLAQAALRDGNRGAAVPCRAARIASHHSPGTGTGHL
jgi:aspartate racemase